MNHYKTQTCVRECVEEPLFNTHNKKIEIEKAFLVHNILPHCWKSDMSVKCRNALAFNCEDGASELQSIHDYGRSPGNMRSWHMYYAYPAQPAMHHLPGQQKVTCMSIIMPLHRCLSVYVLSSQTPCDLSAIKDSVFRLPQPRLELHRPRILKMRLSNAARRMEL
jgi:hypothetical protein